MNGFAPFFVPFSGCLEPLFERFLAFRLGGYAPFYTLPEMSVVKRTVECDLSDIQKRAVLIREGNISAGHRVDIAKE